MQSRLVRLIALAICFVAPLGWVVRADAGTTATVEITGEVVDSSLSLTMTTTTFSLGDVEATGNSYDPVTSIAEPFTIESNPYGIPEGIAWVAKQGIVFRVTSPDIWILRYCSSAQSGTLDGATTLLYMSGSRPSGSSNASSIGETGVKACSSGGPNGFVAAAAVNEPFALYPTYVVRPIDTPHPFSATVQFTLSSI